MLPNDPYDAPPDPYSPADAFTAAAASLQLARSMGLGQSHQFDTNSALQAELAARIAAATAARIQGPPSGYVSVRTVAAPPAAAGGWVNNQAQAAQNYARQRLAQATRAGLLPPNTMMLNGDPAAIWRAASGRVAAAAAAHGYQDAGHWLDLGAPGLRLPANRHPSPGGSLLQHIAQRRTAHPPVWVRA